MGDYPSFNSDKDGRIAYIRVVRKDQLPGNVQAQIEGEGPVYAIHGADGDVLALVRDRSLAFAVARMNKFSPVSVH